MNGSPLKQRITTCKSETIGISKLYLVGYNGLQTIGWSYVFFQFMRFILQNRSSVGIYDKHGLSLLIFQSLAGLEILHVSIGLVSSNLLMTAMQVASRLYQIWGIIYSVPEIHDSPLLGVIAFAWGLTEIVRYSYYTISLLEMKSDILTWCRYSLFYVMYPLGISGEVCTILMSLSAIERRQLYSIALPNAANISFSYYWFNILLLSSSLIVSPVLFNHMRRQRAKVLGVAKPTEKKLD